MTAKYLHCGNLLRKTINNSMDGLGNNTEIIAMIDGKQNDDFDRFNICLNENTHFNEFTFYFTDVAGNIVTPTDFVLVLDVEKTTGKI